VAATGAVEAASAMLVKTVGREGGKAADVMRTFMAQKIEKKKKKKLHFSISARLSGWWRVYLCTRSPFEVKI